MTAAALARRGDRWSGHGRNLLTYNQATVSTDTAGLGARANSSIARSTDQARHGASSVAITSAASGSMGVNTCSGAIATTGGVPVVAGTQYTAVVSTRAATSARSTRVGITWWNSSGAYISESYGSSVANVTTGWTQVTQTATAPTGAVWADLPVQVLSTGAANEVHYADCFGIWTGASTSWIAPLT